MEGLSKAIFQIVKIAGHPMNIFEISIEVYKRLGEATTAQDVESAVQKLVKSKLLAVVDIPSYKAIQ